MLYVSTSLAPATANDSARPVPMAPAAPWGRTVASESGSRVCNNRIVGCTPTCDDGHLALQRTPELGRGDEGVDIGAEARGELGWGWLGLFVGHLCGYSWVCPITILGWLGSVESTGEPLQPGVLELSCNGNNRTACVRTNSGVPLRTGYPEPSPNTPRRNKHCCTSVPG